MCVDDKRNSYYNKNDFTMKITHRRKTLQIFDSIILQRYCSIDTDVNALVIIKLVLKTGKLLSAQHFPKHIT